jgi:hypothetical protein
MQRKVRNRLQSDGIVLVELWILVVVEGFDEYSFSRPSATPIPHSHRLRHKARCCFNTSLLVVNFAAIAQPQKYRIWSFLRALPGPARADGAAGRFHIDEGDWDGIALLLARRFGCISSQLLRSSFRQSLGLTR